MHPLANNIENLKDAELELKINDLSKKYFQTTNPQLQSQILMLLESYKEQLARRRYDEWVKMNESRDKSLDKLINID